MKDEITNLISFIGKFLDGELKIDESEYVERVNFKCKRLQEKLIQFSFPYKSLENVEISGYDDSSRIIKSLKQLRGLLTELKNELEHGITKDLKKRISRGLT